MKETSETLSGANSMVEWYLYSIVVVVVHSRPKVKYTPLLIKYLSDFYELRPAL